jgi:hypothetical protein
VESREPAEVVCINVYPTSLYGGRPKSLDCRSGRCSSAAWHIEGLRPSCAENSLWLELAGGGPGVGALHAKGTEYFYIWNSLQGSQANLDGDEMLTSCCVTLQTLWNPCPEALLTGHTRAYACSPSAITRCSRALQGSSHRFVTDKTLTSPERPYD